MVCQFCFTCHSWACSLEKIAQYLLLLITYSIWHNQVRFSEDPIMSSCVKPMMQNKENPVVLLHGFDRCSKQVTECVHFYAQVTFGFHFTLLIVQLMFRMEIHISVAWGSWLWDMGSWHSWLGFLWSRFAFLLLLCYGHSFLSF